MFNNIMDIYELTVTLLGSLEDMLEISEEKQVPALGSCFEELAEVCVKIKKIFYFNKKKAKQKNYFIYTFILF